MTLLHQQLVNFMAAEFSNVAALSRTGTPIGKTKKRIAAATHKPSISDDWHGEGATRKRRTRTCKVCSLLRRAVGKSAAQTSWYCESCSEDTTRPLLHIVPVNPSKDNKSCFDVWHEEVECGRSIPEHFMNRIALRVCQRNCTRRERRKLNQHRQRAAAVLLQLVSLLTATTMQTGVAKTRPHLGATALQHQSTRPVDQTPQTTTHTAT